MSSVCPACGVAVVPGYVRCPKCHAALSLAGTTTGRLKRIDPGGTALPDKSFPVSAVLVGLGVIVAMILLFGLRGGSKQTAAAAIVPPDPIAATPIRPPVTARRVAPAPEAPAPAAADPPSVAAASRELEAVLRQQRLWGRLEITGTRIDVRSGACADRAMPPAIDGRAALLHDAGLTKLRCLEQSGAVVFERDL
jgi:hypothetical protein